MSDDLVKRLEEASQNGRTAIGADLAQKAIDEIKRLRALLVGESVPEVVADTDQPAELIDTSDIPEQGKEFFAKAKLHHPAHRAKPSRAKHDSHAKRK